MRYLRLLMLCMAASATLFAGTVIAQGAGTYPSRPITAVVAIDVGSPSDLEVRLYTPKLSEFLGQPVIVEYKPGAGTSIGSAYVAKSAPDGYTMLYITSAITALPVIYKDLSFDPVKDFAPISQMSQKLLVLMVSLPFPAKTFAEYIAYAKANPGKINYGTSGGGSTGHLAGVWLHGATNTTVTFVPYKGMPPMVTDILTGRTDTTVPLLSLALPLVRSGKVRLLAILADKRSKLIPEVPTVAEQGIPEFNQSTWGGFVAPSATPVAIINKISEAFVRTSKTPDVIASLEKANTLVIGNTPAEFRQVIVSETERWRKMFQNLGGYRE